MHATLSQLGTASFEEPLGRHRALHQEFEDRREERRKNGVLKWNLEHGVPDVGGLSWRSKTGHQLKNQAWYGTVSGENKWNNAAHAGTNTWKDYHGPKQRVDADMMQRLDRMEEQQDGWDAKRLFVNTVRVQTLDRFANKRTQNEQFEQSASWAPHRRVRREVHDALDGFTDEIDSMPVKELKKVLTDDVLKFDREAVRQISKKLQTEATWKQAWKQMESERRKDILEDFRQRRMYNDMLTRMSGQPPRQHDPGHRMPNNANGWTTQMAKHKEDVPLSDITAMSEFRGLVHVDHAFALEALQPGYGYAASREFRRRATRSAGPGWPPPERPATPERPKTGLKPMSVTSPGGDLQRTAIPASAHVMNMAASRVDDQALLAHAREMYSWTEAPPAPDQKNALLQESWGPKSALMDPDRKNGLGSMRTNHTARRGPELVPPPLRQYTYPVVAPSADETRANVAARLNQRGASEGRSRTFRTRRAVASASDALSARSGALGGQGMASAARGFEDPTPCSAAICDGLDHFERHVEDVLEKTAGTTTLPWQDDLD